MQRILTDLFLCCPLIQPEFRLYLLTNIHEVKQVKWMDEIMQIDLNFMSQKY